MYVPCVMRALCSWEHNENCAPTIQNRTFTNTKKNIYEYENEHFTVEVEHYKIHLLMKWNITRFIYEKEHFTIEVEHYQNPNTKMNIFG